MIVLSNAELEVVIVASDKDGAIAGRVEVLAIGTSGVVVDEGSAQMDVSVGWSTTCSVQVVSSDPAVVGVSSPSTRVG